MPPNPPSAPYGGAAAGANAGAGPISAQQSHFFNPHSQPASQRQNAIGRLPRLSSLLPSASFTPANSAPTHLHPNLSKPLPSPHGPTSNPASQPPDSGRLETTSRNERHPPHNHINRHLDDARPPQPDLLHPFNRLPESHRASSYYVNRWSASTNSSHGHSASLSRSPPPPRSPTTPTRRSSSVDITFFLAGSPPSANVASWNRRASRTPTESQDFLASLAQDGANTAHYHNYIGDQRPAASDSFRQRTATEQPRYPPRDASLAVEDHNGLYKPPTGQAGDSSTPSPSRPRARAATSESVAMQYESGQDHHYANHGHARSRSGKSSGDSTKYRSAKPPSQKAMLSHALQRANAAVQLDNSQDFIGARAAYTEACTLLEQVLQRTTAQEDQRKLEAIRETYTSRIDELDQMVAFQSKELPAFPDDDDDDDESLHREPIVYSSSAQHREDEEEAVIETATMTRIIKEDDPDADYYYQHSTNASQRWHENPLPPSHSPPLPPMQPPEPGFLQSSFSKSPIRSRFPAGVMQTPSEPSHGPSHVALLPGNPQSNQRDDEIDEPIHADFSASSRSRAEMRRKPEHHREDSQNSWLDPIDESGGSTESSVHSRTSSFGYRRRHIRAGSGNTENEFDNALDAAIEAAYDDGYEPMEPHDYIRRDSDDVAVADVLRRVELARERVRQTEREAYDVANELERQRLQLQRYQQQEDKQQQKQPAVAQEPPLSSLPTEDFDNHFSDDDVEQMLEEMRVYTTQDYSQYGQGSQQQKREPQPSVPRESDSSGLTTSTWNSSAPSNTLTNGTTLSTVTESATLLSVVQGPAPAPPPTGALPELPPPRPSSAQSKSVLNRRSTNQNHKQLKIETAKITPAVSKIEEDPTHPKSTASAKGPASSIEPPKSSVTTTLRRPISPPPEASPTDSRPLGSPFGQRSTPDVDDAANRSTSPSVSRLKKNFSSSSLKSMKGRAMSISNIDEGDMSPITPSSSHFGGSRPPAVPAIPTPIVASLRDRSDTATGGMYLLDADFHSPATMGSPGQGFPEAPVPLEPCPTDTMLRPFWLMRCLYQTLVHPRGGYVSSKLFIPREAWRVRNVKLKNIDEKIANCDYLSAALLKLAKVDTCDADAVLEEMQSLEGILEQVQSALSRKLGNEVGVQGAGILFKDAATPTDGDSSNTMPRTASVSGKSAFSWRRLRSKNSAAALGNTSAPRGGADASKETMPSLPMTASPTSRPPKRVVSLALFDGPNALYMGSLARLFDAAQVVDQIARQVDDPGLRHADKTQVGLELCTRHAAEFFAFYICRFVLADIGLLMDKFIKRGTEWVLA